MDTRSRLLTAMVAAAALGAGGAAAVVVGDEDPVAAPPQPAAAAVTVTVASTVEAEGVPVPALVGVRLDEATTLLESAALTRRIDGGGLLGVLDDSGWVVCATTPATGVRVPAGATVVVHVERSCV